MMEPLRSHKFDTWDPAIYEVIARVPIQSYTCRTFKDSDSFDETIEVIPEKPNIECVLNADDSTDRAKKRSVCGPANYPLLNRMTYPSGLPSAVHANRIHDYNTGIRIADEIATKKEKNEDRQFKKNQDAAKRKRKALPPPKRISAYGSDLVIGKQIGTGGYSQCFEARSLTGHQFAAKFISRDCSQASYSRARIEREMAIHQRLSHSNIVKLWQFVECEKHFALVLDYCPNCTLQDLIARRGALREPAVCEIMSHILDAVDYLHARFIHHGDLKLSNILLNAQMQPMLADFGFAKQLHSATHNRTHLCGTPSYMAPEILSKPCSFGLPSDVWAMGIIAYTLLYGRTPFDAKTVRKVYTRILSYDLRFPPLSTPVSPDLLLFIRIMLDPDPSQRPTVRTLVNAHQVDATGTFSGNISSFKERIRALEEERTPRVLSVTSIDEKLNCGEVVCMRVGDPAIPYVAMLPSVSKTKIVSCDRTPLTENEDLRGFRKVWSVFWTKRIRLGKFKKERKIRPAEVAR